MAPKVPMVVRRFPSFVDAPKIERRAQQISDPIERLRYLRQATGTATLRHPGRRWTWLASFALVVVVVPLHTTSNANVRRPLDLRLPAAQREAGAVVPNVWLVDKTNEFEVYSNGLRVENQLSVANEPRWHSPISRAAQSGPRRSQPAEPSRAFSTGSESRDHAYRQGTTGICPKQPGFPLRRGPHWTR